MSDEFILPSSTGRSGQVLDEINHKQCWSYIERYPISWKQQADGMWVGIETVVHVVTAEHAKEIGL